MLEAFCVHRRYVFALGAYCYLDCTGPTLQGRSELAAKGLWLVSRAEADLLAAYFVDQQHKLNSGSVSVGMGCSSYGRHGSVGYNMGASEYDQAVLTIDLLAPADDKMIWRGVGTRVAYEGSNPEKFTQIVNEAVSKILKKFLPKKRSASYRFRVAEI